MLPLLIVIDNVHIQNVESRIVTSLGGCMGKLARCDSLKSLGKRKIKPCRNFITLLLLISLLGSLLVGVVGASDGDYIWAKRMGGTAVEFGSSIAVDSSSNVYTTGFFQGTVDFDPGVGTVELTSAGDNDIFVSKLDSSGNYAWAKRFGGTSSEQGEGIVVDGSGKVYTPGNFMDMVDFDHEPGTAELTSAGNNDVLISKLDSRGN